jgi:hypothetical protein
MVIVEEAGSHLEYTAAVHPAVAGRGELQASAAVWPGNIRNEVWFRYRFDGEPWVTKKATRQRSPVSQDRFLLSIPAPETRQKFSLYGFIRRGTKIIPRRAETAAVDPASLEDLVVDLSNVDGSKANVGGPQDQSVAGTDMATGLLLQLTAITPFWTVDSVPMAIWTYSLGWSQTYFAVSQGQNPGVSIGLEFSRRMAIQDPARFPDVPAVQTTRLSRPRKGDVQYVYRILDAASKVIDFSFIAPAERDGFCPVKLVQQQGTATSWSELPFKIATEGDIAFQQVMTGPAITCLPAGGGKTTPSAVLPYATELFGTYQPLIGWVGQFGQSWLLRNPGRVDGQLLASRTSVFGPTPSPIAILSPVGLVNLFREYFFEIDTFLGVPTGHVWLSPGGVVELIEVSTRKTTIERTVEESVETASKTESALTRQDDLADAVKEDNQTNIRLGISVSEQAKFTPVIEANANQSFSLENSVHHSQEEAHKHSRTQSERVSNEIRRNFKTTFRTVTETTDTTSRRYVLQNTTDKLVNYELRRKMRKVAVQVQHIGTQLSWQSYLDEPGRRLGLGEMVHTVPVSDAVALMTPPNPVGPKETAFKAKFPWMPVTVDNDGSYPPADQRYRSIGDHVLQGEFGGTRLETYAGGSGDNSLAIYSEYTYTAAAPGPDYSLTGVRVNDSEVPAWVIPKIIDGARGVFRLHLLSLNPDGHNGFMFDLTLRWDPQRDSALDSFNQKLAAAQKADFTNAVRQRLKLISNLRPRSPEDLRSEERHLVYGALIELLTERLSLDMSHEVVAELVRQIFDVDEMLYFVAPDYWKPRLQQTGDPGPVKYPPPAELNDLNPVSLQKSLQNETVLSWYGHQNTDINIDSKGKTITEVRNNYLITEETLPAPMGSSLGWLIQIDGDERRNEFLNAAWVKAVFPVRPGKELDALDFLAAANVEGEGALSAPYVMQPGDPASYQGLTIGEVLRLLAEQLRASNLDIKNTLATEKAFENGFDPLDGGFRVTAPYQVFDQWVEVIPTDQVVAVDYDPTKHGA